MIHAHDEQAAVRLSAVHWWFGNALAKRKARKITTTV